MTIETSVQKRRAEAEADLASKSMYELLGGEVGIKALVNRFYDLMENDPRFKLVREMHNDDLTSMRESLFEFLSGWLGGPPLFVQRRGTPCLTEVHAPFTIDQEARDLWLACISRAMVDVGIDEKYRELLGPALEGMADTIRNDV
jgi:hemoglobin